MIKGHTLSALIIHLWGFFPFFFWCIENNWFQSAPLWPCEPADLTSRSHVLMQLAEKTSHRDALEVLSNLPGIKEPNGERP